jgi:hypothetical protein
MAKIFKALESNEKPDAVQARMNAAAEAVFNNPELYAKLHEFDAACQDERQRM